MNSITQIPQIIGNYETGNDSDASLTKALQEMGIKLGQVEFEKLIDAVKTGVIAKLPDGFQGARNNDNPGSIILYTTRKPRRKPSA